MSSAARSLPSNVIRFPTERTATRTVALRPGTNPKTIGTLTVGSNQHKRSKLCAEDVVIFSYAIEPKPSDLIVYKVYGGSPAIKRHEELAVNEDYLGVIIAVQRPYQGY